MKVKTYLKPKAIAEMMIKKGIEDETLAGRLGILRGSLYTTYLNNTNAVSKRTASRLAKALECDPMEIADVVVEDEKGEG